MIGERCANCSTALRLLFDCDSTKGASGRTTVEADSKNSRTLPEHVSNTSRTLPEGITQKKLYRRSYADIAISGSDTFPGMIL